MGKSAQILFHIWLPDAMEGPTPVSALIHAATMVTAGIFLILKCSFVYESSGLSLLLLVLIGGCTAFMSGTIGMVQFDIKKIIAYSTCSQLGYMLLSIGFFNQNTGFFHLMNHAFFKAILFLCAGCLIHNLIDDQDIRKYGGFLKSFPLTFIFFLCGSLSLCGFLFLTGFYSKDFILENFLYAFSFYDLSLNTSFILCFLLLTTMITSNYAIRLFFFIFINPFRFQRVFLKFIFETQMELIEPLWILFFGTIFIGYYFKDFFLGAGTFYFFQSTSTAFFLNLPFEAEFLNVEKKIFFLVCFLIVAPGLVSVSILKLLAHFIIKNNITSVFIVFKYKWLRILYSFFSLKWGFDVIYNKKIAIVFFSNFYLIAYEFFDKFLLEHFNGHYRINNFFSNFLISLKPLLQSGVFFYNFLMFPLSIFFLCLV